MIIFTLVEGAFHNGTIPSFYFWRKNYNLLYTSRDIGSVVCTIITWIKSLIVGGFFGEGNSRNVKHTESLNSLDFYFDSSSKWFNTVGDTNAILALARVILMRDGETLVLTS